MKKVVMKFGGASLESPLRIENVAMIIKSYSKQSIIVVVSAIGDSTNQLIEAGENAYNNKIDYNSIKEKHKKICDVLSINFDLLHPLFDSLEDTLVKISKDRKLEAKMIDLLMSYGERMSSIILSEVLKKHGLMSIACNSWDVGILSNNKYQDAEILSVSKESVKEKINRHLRKGIIPVVTGFIARTEKGEITTLGRGASDLTASFIGAAINASEIILWKDVDGILSSNPKIVQNTIKLNEISYQQATDMAYYGAEVLHPLALLPAQQENIEIKVKNFLDPLATGTKIYNLDETGIESRKVKTISYRQNLKIVHIIPLDCMDFLEFYKIIYEFLSESQIPADMLSMEKSGVSFLIDKDYNIEKLKKILTGIAKVEMHLNMAIVSLIGKTKNSSNMFSKIFGILNMHSIDIKMISSGISYRNISFIVEDEFLEKTINLLHDELIIVK